MGNCKAAMCADFAGVIVIAGSFAQVVPWLASAAALLWYLIQVYESKTGQDMVSRLLTNLADDTTRLVLIFLTGVLALVALTITVAIGVSK